MKSTVTYQSDLEGELAADAQQRDRTTSAPEHGRHNLFGALRVSDVTSNGRARPVEFLDSGHGSSSAGHARPVSKI